MYLEQAGLHLYCTVNALLVIEVRPDEEAVKVRDPVLAPLVILRFENVATPFTACTFFVEPPVRVEVVDMVTLVLLVVTVLPYRS